MKNLIPLAAFVALSACTEGLNGLGGVADTAAANDAAVQGATVTPPLRPAPDTTQATAIVTPPPAPTAVTVEQFDTTTAEDRAEAVSTPSGGARLGATIASLGSPTDPGLWLKTPLVSEVTQGRVEYNGTSVALELRPTGGAAGSGSQISLAAMRLTGAALTALPEMTVYAN